MWATRTFDRARRRFRATPDADAAPDETPAPEASETDARCTVVIAFGREEKARFSAELAAALGPDTPRLDTPDRLADGVLAAIRRAGGDGRPVVTRSPAGVYTPEYWRVRVEDADTRAHAELERLAGRRLDR